jgi:hypothetical protein
MNTYPVRPRPRHLFVALIFAASAALCCATAAHAADGAGTNQSRPGMLLSRAKPGDAWRVVDEKGSVPGDVLLIGLPGAIVTSANGGVEVHLRADFHSPLPVLEPALELHASDKADLDFALARGRVDVKNIKEKGAAHVHVRCWGATFDLTLEAPGARVALETLGRWPAGAPFTRKPGPHDVPSADLIFLVLSGEMDLAYEGTHYRMTAPPGPATIRWNNFGGLDRAPQALDKLPHWAELPTDPKELEEIEKKKATLAKIAAGFAAHPTGEVIDKLLASEEPFERRLGVLLSGALDDLPRLAKVLNQPGHQDMWDVAVVALRHWLGREPGQDLKLYDGLIKLGTKEVQAESIIEFLHGFSEADLDRPETYQMLIDYLVSDRLALRGLAHWHLIRLVPKADEVPYDPAGSMEELKKARDAFKKLLPPGKLPRSEPKPGDKGK